MRTLRMAVATALLLSLAAGPTIAAVPTSPDTPLRGCAADAPDRGDVATAYGRLPLSFEPNAGQFADEVRFRARGAGYALWLTPDEAVLSLAAPAPGGADDASVREAH